MKKKANEYMEALLCAYIILTAGVLPLYMRDGMNMIGDAKYLFFIRSALLVFGLWAVGLVILLVLSKKEKRTVSWPLTDGWSLTDSFVLLYGASVLLSFCFSEYKQEALFGYADWHMGLVTQLLLVWSYFFVSRFYKRETYAWKAAGAAAFAVFVLGVLNRYNVDPLGIYRGMDFWDWNRLNLLSTIGNINWYCGYVCMIFPLFLCLFWSSRGWKRTLGGVGSFISFFTIFTQGSASGLLGLGAVMAVLLWASLKERDKLMRFCQLAVMLTLAPPIAAVTSEMFWPYRMRLYPFGFICDLVFWKGWYPAAALAGAGILVLYLRRKTGRRDLLENGMCSRVYAAGASGILVLGLLFLLLCQVSEGFWRLTGALSQLRIEGDWGSGRGALWKLSVECFVRGGLKQKIFGAGPDCFACVIYDMFDVGSELFVVGQWQGAIFANAHNEWLNMLVTGGLLGAVSYLGIFVSMFVRCIRGREKQAVLMAGMMMIAGYAANNSFSFQQVIVTPVMFVMLGMMESYNRNFHFSLTAEG